MSTNIDKILDLIDVGLQRTSEPNMESIERDRCARCQMNGLDGDGDLCEPCRAYLLGDADDPMELRLTLPSLPHLPIRSPYQIVDRHNEACYGLDLTPGVTINIEDFIVDREPRVFHTSDGRTIGYGEVWFPPDD